MRLYISSKFALALVIILVVSATPSIVADDWTSFRHDSTSTGASSDPGALVGAIDWAVDYENGGIMGSVLAEGDRIYFTTGGVWDGMSTTTDPKAFCVDTSTGDVIWSHTYDRGTYEITTAMIMDDHLIVPCSCGEIIALDKDDGHEVWQFDVGNPSSGWIYGASTPIEVDGDIVFGTSLGKVYRLTSDGDEVWSAQVCNVIRFGAPSYKDGIIYIGGMDGRVHALYANNGTMAWQTRVIDTSSNNDQVPSTPLLLDDRLLVAFNDGSFVPWVSGVCALDYGGNELWRNTSVGVTSSSVALLPTGDVALSSDQGILCFDIDGNFRWRASIGAIKGSVGVSATALYGTSYDSWGSTYALSFDGDVLWEVPLLPNDDDAYSMVGPTVHGGYVYVANDGGYVYRIGIGEGFTTTVDDLEIHLESTFLDQGATITWDLGDGTTSSGGDVTHTYDAYGEYDVTMRAVNATMDINITRAVVLMPIDFDYQVNGLTVTFEANGVYDEYLWDFGDGSFADGPNVTHTYGTHGEYVITLTTVDGGDEHMSQSTIMIEEQGFSTVVDDLTVTFSVTLDGEGMTHTWDFGDGSSGKGANTTHVYDVHGSYDVTLVSVNDTVRSNVTGHVVLVAGPIAGLSVELDGLDASFDASPSEGDGLTYEWDLGDGSSSVGVQLTHPYAGPGNYTVRLEVTDVDGRTDNCSVVVMVSEGVVPTPPSGDSGHPIIIGVAGALIGLFAGLVIARTLGLGDVFQRLDPSKLKLLTSTAIVAMTVVATFSMTGTVSGGDTNEVSVMFDLGPEVMWTNVDAVASDTSLEVTLDAGSMLGLSITYDGTPSITSIGGIHNDDTGSWTLWARNDTERAWTRTSGDLVDVDPLAYDALGWGFGDDAPFEYLGPTTDYEGNTIFLGYLPSTIVTTAPSVTETACAVGGLQYLVGVSQYCDYPCGVVEGVSNGSIGVIGSFTNPNLEKIIDVNPDIVLAYGGLSSHISVANSLNSLGITSLVLFPEDSIDSIYDNIYLTGQVIGRANAAQMLILNMKARSMAIEDVVSQATSSPRTLVTLGIEPTSPAWVAGGGTYIDDIMSRDMATNVFGDSLTNSSIGLSWFQASKELILERDPEVIMVTSDDNSISPEDYYEHVMEVMSNDDVWSRTRAYIDGNVYVVTSQANNVFSRAGPRVVDALDLMSKMVHPELFEDELPHWIGDDYTDYLDYY